MIFTELSPRGAESRIYLLKTVAIPGENGAPDAVDTVADRLLWPPEATSEPLPTQFDCLEYPIPNDAVSFGNGQPGTWDITWGSLQGTAQPTAHGWREPSYGQWSPDDGAPVMGADSDGDINGLEGPTLSIEHRSLPMQGWTPNDYVEALKDLARDAVEILGHEAIIGVTLPGVE